MTNYHEPIEKLTPHTLDLSRAIHSLMEELEAIDWYQQRVDATDDPALKTILGHNRDEEKEHAVMVLEWLRRKDPKLDELMREILFKDGAIEGEHAGEGPTTTPARRSPALTVGRLGGNG